MTGAERRRLLVFFAAGAGAPGGHHRFAKLGLALRTALSQESGEEPTPIAKSLLSDALIFSVSTTLSAVDFGNALITRLREPFFFSEHSDHADKTVITEIGDKFFATSAITKTLIGWQRNRTAK